MHKAVIVSVAFSTTYEHNQSDSEQPSPRSPLPDDITRQAPVMARKSRNCFHTCSSTSALGFRQTAINSTPSPLDVGLAPPPLFTTKLEAAPFLASDVMQFSKMQVFHVSQQTSPLAEELPFLLPNISSNTIYAYMLCIRVLPIPIWIQTKGGQRVRSGSTDQFLLPDSSQRHEKGCEGQTGECNQTTFP